jgi:hypothetical protein
MNNSEQKPSYYSILTADVRYHDKLSPFDKLLYSDITALTNKKGYCNASNKYFSKVFNKSIRAISRSISTLSDNSLITTTLIRDENNEIVERKIYLNQTVSIGMEENVYTPIAKNDDTPIAKNVQYNNTSNINTTSKNIKSNSINTITKKKSNHYDLILESWNEFARSNGLSEIRQLTTKRINGIKSRQKENGFNLQEIFNCIQDSPFLLGTNGNDWKADFDWVFCSPNNWLKIVEGKYKGEKKQDPQDKLQSIYDELIGGK